jgi:hypothetical protein
VKWSPRARLIRPFIDGGVTYRHISGEDVTQFYGATGTSGISQSLPAANHPNIAGPTVGGGITARLARVLISPEVRYTYWPSPSYAGDYVFRLLRANQVDVLVGFTF